MDIFNKVYLNILSEARTPFNTNGAELLPTKYIPIDSIKQCLISNHLLFQIQNRDDKFFKNNYTMSENRDFIFKNFSLILKELFTNKKYLNQIEDNEFQNKSTEFIISTDKFANDKNTHLIVIAKVNSKSDLNGKNKFYVLFVTSYIKNENEFAEFLNQDCKSLNHTNQIPIRIIGENSYK